MYSAKRLWQYLMKMCDADGSGAANVVASCHRCLCGGGDGPHASGDVRRCGAYGCHVFLSVAMRQTKSIEMIETCSTIASSVTTWMPTVMCQIRAKQAASPTSH